MNIPVFPAVKWNDFAALARSAFPFPGANARLSYDPTRGVTISAVPSDDYSHPWKVRCVWEYFSEELARYEGEGEWRAYVEPGFVNGRDAYLAMPRDWPVKPVRGGATRDVALTDDPAPFLSLTAWRNPLAPAGVGATLEGEIVYAKGEGYPPFFEKLGVRPAARGGTEPEPGYEEGRTRELRAADIVLTKPRLGSSLGVTVLDPLTTGYTHRVETNYEDSYYRSTGGRSRLTAVAKFTPLEQQWVNSPFLGLPMNAGDPQYDQRKIATVYVVSPPNYGTEAVPDAAWSAYPQHATFWNLSHATRFTPPPKKLEPIRLVTGLGLGILDTLANAMLAPINSAFDEVNEFLHQSDMRGIFWTT